METDSVIFCTQNLSFGRPGASILAPWAIVGDHGTTGRTRRSLESDFYRFWDDFGPILKAFWAPRAKILCFFLLVSRSPFAPIFESKSGRLGLPKQGFGVKCIAKNKFSQKSEFS